MRPTVVRPRALLAAAGADTRVAGVPPSRCACRAELRSFSSLPSIFLPLVSTSGSGVARMAKTVYRH